MKKLKQNQLGHWCSYCPSKTTRAVYRLQYDTTKDHCCNEHIAEAREDERKAQSLRNKDLSEADYQTWMRL